MPPRLQQALDTAAAELGSQQGRQLTRSSTRLLQSLRRGSRTSSRGGKNPKAVLDPASGLRVRPRRVRLICLLSRFQYCRATCINTFTPVMRQCTPDDIAGATLCCVPPRSPVPAINSCCGSYVRAAPQLLMLA